MCGSQPGVAGAGDRLEPCGGADRVSLCEDVVGHRRQRSLERGAGGDGSGHVPGVAEPTGEDRAIAGPWAPMPIARGRSGRRSAENETGRSEAGWQRGLRGGWPRGRTWEALLKASFRNGTLYKSKRDVLAICQSPFVQGTNDACSDEDGSCSGRVGRARACRKRQALPPTQFLGSKPAPMPSSRRLRRCERLLRTLASTSSRRTAAALACVCGSHRRHDANAMPDGSRCCGVDLLSAWSGCGRSRSRDPDFLSRGAISKASVSRLRRAFEEAGLVFDLDAGVGSGVRLKDTEKT